MGNIPCVENNNTLAYKEVIQWVFRGEKHLASHIEQFKNIPQCILPISIKDRYIDAPKIVCILVLRHHFLKKVSSFPISANSPFNKPLFVIGSVTFPILNSAIAKRKIVLSGISIKQD